MVDPERENTRSRLLKVLRLAQQGVGGERENAEALLEKLLRKHSMTLADLEDASGQPRATVWLAAADNDEQTVLSQLMISLFGTSRKLWHRAGIMDVGVDASPSEYAALVVAWDVYRAAFVEARRAMVMAFCFKHNLYASDSSDTSAMTAEDRERAARALAMAEVLPVVDAPAGRLGSGGT